MSNSSLVEYTLISPHSRNRTAKIDTITIHHMAGNATIESCGRHFQGEAKVSANYGIGSDGRIAMYVEEKNRSIASFSTANDNRAVTIEVANCTEEPDWKVTDAALESLIRLCVDICQRNGIERLNYTGDKSGNLTMHKWFVATGCPGPYLESKFPWIAEEVNKRLSEEKVKEIYRVQFGAYSQRASAETALNDLREAVRIAQDAVNILEEALGEAFVSKGVTDR